MATRVAPNVQKRAADVPWGKSALRRVFNPLFGVLPRVLDPHCTCPYLAVMNWISLRSRHTSLSLVLLATCVALSQACNTSTQGEGDGDDQPGDGDGDAGGLGGDGVSGGDGSGGDGASGGSGGMPAGGSGGTGGMDSGPTIDCTPHEGQITTLGLSEVASNLDEPTHAVAAPDDPDILYIVEQGGKVKRLVPGETPTTFLNVSAKTDRESFPLERGLLGLAFHPDYEENGLFYVHYTDVDGDSVVEEYERSLDPTLAKPVAVRPIFEQPQPYQNNNGGNIAFHPSDGLLYLALGDGGNAGDPMDNAQTAGNLLGSLFAIDLSEDPIPTPTSWDIGLRNPFRFSFDPCTGDRYIADSSFTGDYQEINIASHEASRNWGWNVMEGDECFQAATCDSDGLSDPAHFYGTNPSGGPFNLGGFVYRGSLVPELRGMYLFADYNTGDVGGLRWTSEGGASEATNLTDLLDTSEMNIGGFGQDGHGEVYLIERVPGTVYRIER